MYAITKKRTPLRSITVSYLMRQSTRTKNIAELCWSALVQTRCSLVLYPTSDHVADWKRPLTKGQRVCEVLDVDLRNGIYSTTKFKRWDWLDCLICSTMSRSKRLETHTVDDANNRRQVHKSPPGLHFILRIGVHLYNMRIGPSFAFPLSLSIKGYSTTTARKRLRVQGQNRAECI